MESEEHYFERIKQYKLIAKHEVGQNFLIDPRTARAIVDLAGLDEKDKVLEIGCGAGSLSYFIAASPATSFLLDIDEALIAKLRHDFGSQKRVTPTVGNVLRHDLSPYTKIIGNLPYYITSAIIEKILLQSNAKKAVLMIQKEAFARLVSPCGGKNYGPLSILMSYRASTKKSFIVPRSNFVPEPHVDSLVFCLDFDSKSDVVTARRLYDVVSALFLHRRKTIGNNLGYYLGNSSKAKDVLTASGISFNLRPEDVSLERYLYLVHQLY